MFGASETSNPLDAKVLKATDESLMSDNWEYIMDVCDAVNDDPDGGPHNAIKALEKRLRINNANILLRSLSLLLSLAENCGSKMKQEISSSEFTNGSLYGIVSNKSIHYSIKVKLVEIMTQLSDSFKSDPSLRNLEKTLTKVRSHYPNLDTNFKDNGPAVPSKDRMSDAELRSEEEQLQAVLKLSLDEYNETEKFKNSWTNAIGPAPNSNESKFTSGPGHSGNQNFSQFVSQGSSQPKTSFASQQPQQQIPQHAASQQSALQPVQQQAQQPAQQQLQQQETGIAAAATGGPSVSVADIKKTDRQTPAMINKVMALYDLDTTEPGELAFHKGDVIVVLESAFKDWWRGSLKGKVGIFPLNYVTPIKEPTKQEMVKDIEIEYNISQQTKNIERLLVKLQTLNASNDPSEILNTANDEYIQSLYNNITPLRPQVARLIEKYSRKKEDLISLDTKLTEAERKYNELMDAAISKYKQPIFTAPAPGTHAIHNPYVNLSASTGMSQQQHHPQPPSYGQAPAPTGAINYGNPLGQSQLPHQAQSYSHTGTSSIQGAPTGYAPQGQQQQHQPQQTHQPPQQHTGAYHPPSGLPPALNSSSLPSQSNVNSYNPVEPIATGIGFGNSPSKPVGLNNFNPTGNTTANNGFSAQSQPQLQQQHESAGAAQAAGKTNPPYPTSTLPLDLPSSSNITTPLSGGQHTTATDGSTGGAGISGSSPFPRNSNVFLPKPM